MKEIRGKVFMTRDRQQAITMKKKKKMSTNRKWASSPLALCLYIRDDYVFLKFSMIYHANISSFY